MQKKRRREEREERREGGREGKTSVSYLRIRHGRHRATRRVGQLDYSIKGLCHSHLNPNDNHGLGRVFPLGQRALHGGAQAGSVGEFLGGDLEGDGEGDRLFGDVAGDFNVDGFFLCQGRDDGVVNLTRRLRGGTDFHDFGDDVREHVDLLAAVDFAF